MNGAPLWCVCSGCWTFGAITHLAATVDSNQCPSCGHKGMLGVPAKPAPRQQANANARSHDRRPGAGGGPPGPETQRGTPPAAAGDASA